ncbi:hypothetical protein MZA98_10430, partial [Haemophilus influenzae]
MIVAYAPIAGVLLGVSRHRDSVEYLDFKHGFICAVALAGRLAYRSYLQKSGKSVAQFSGSLKPFSVMGLIFDGGVTVRLSSPNHYCQSFDYSADCHSLAGTDLRHFCLG